MTKINPYSEKKVFKNADLVYEEIEPIKSNIRKDNFSSGLIGAIFGSVIGVMIMLLLDKTVYLSSISGIFMAICVLGLYYRLSGIISKKGFATSIIIMIIMTIFAKNVAYSLRIINDVSDNFFHIFWNFYSYMKNGLISFDSYFTNIIFTLLFIIIGSIGIIYTFNIEIKNNLS